MVEYRVVAVEARRNYRLWVRFADGVQGEADLSDIAGRGVGGGPRTRPSSPKSTSIPCPERRPGPGGSTWRLTVCMPSWLLRRRPRLALD